MDIGGIGEKLESPPKKTPGKKMQYLHLLSIKKVHSLITWLKEISDTVRLTEH